MLTLCLIIKNEERFLQRCIEPTLNYVSDIIIGDTGSTDRSLEIAKKYTNKVYSISFDEGFANARNQILQKVTTPWVLFLDADEIFDIKELEALLLLLPTLSEDIGALSVLRYNFFASGAFYSSQVIRLFRNSPSIAYSGRIVDSIKPSLVSGGLKLKNTQVILNHFGHCRSSLERYNKAIKYLKLIDEELTHNPTSTKLLAYKALILRTVGQFDQALRLALSLLETNPHEPHLYFTLGHVKRCFNDFEGCIEAYSKAIELGGFQSLYLNARALSYLALDRDDLATQDLEKATNLYPDEPHLSLNLGLVYEKKQDYQQAYTLYETVAERAFGFLHNEVCSLYEFDPYSPLIFDTAFGFKGLNYHMSFCKSRLS